MPVYKARVLASAAGVSVHNSLHVQCTVDDPAAIAQDLANAWRANMLAILNQSYVFSGVEVEQIESDASSVFSAGTTGATLGAGAGTSLPTFVCASVRLNTALRGRAGAGRLGLGPLNEVISVTTGNTMDTSGINSVKAAVDGFIADIASSGGTTPMLLAVVSYYKGVDAQGKPIKRAAPVVNTVTSTSVNAVLGTRLSRHPNR